MSYAPCLVVGYGSRRKGTKMRSVFFERKKEKIGLVKCCSNFSSFLIVSREKRLVNKSSGGQLGVAFFELTLRQKAKTEKKQSLGSSFFWCVCDVKRG